MSATDKPKCTTDKYGTKRWILDGRLHRENGSAVVYANGSKEWYVNGFLHREDGPAIEYADGNKEWYLNGVLLDPIVHFLKVGELSLDKS